MSTLAQWRRSASRCKLGCVVRELATAQEFIAANLEEFPKPRAEAEGFEGPPHVQIGVLAGIAQRAKGAWDWKTYQQVLDLVDRFLPRADSELHNAIHVSFLEHIDFIGLVGRRRGS